MPEVSNPVAEVISIGDEMTSGARLDTNSQWLSTMLGELGVKVKYHSTVGDSLEACQRVFEAAAERADVVVLTGGLGPTADDLTREVLAKVALVELEFREEAMKHIESLFSRRNRSMPERNRVQAMFPVGSDIIPNPQGTAPGIDILIQRGEKRARFFALPGVPAEMQQMWHETVSGEIQKWLGPAPIIRRAVVKCFGLGESEMEARLGDMIARQRSPLVGITVSKATISLRIEAIADSEIEATSQIDAIKQQIHEKVGDYVFGEGDEYELPQAVLELLAKRHETICVIELGKASLLGNWLSASTAGYNTYQGAVHGVDIDQVSKTLNVGDVSIHQVTTRLLQLTSADWCVLVDHYPPLTPPDGQPLPAADVCVVLQSKNGEDPLVYADQLGGHPDIIQERIAKAALFHVYRSLLNL